jgi:hypothetical protein
MNLSFYHYLIDKYILDPNIFLYIHVHVYGIYKYICTPTGVTIPDCGPKSKLASKAIQCN